MMPKIGAKSYRTCLISHIKLLRRGSSRWATWPIVVALAILFILPA